MTIGKLIYLLTYHIKNFITQFERLYRKIINSNYSQVFNKIYYIYYIPSIYSGVNGYFKHSLSSKYHS